MKRVYQICKRTVMDISDPNIKFDERGICDHVYDFENYVKPNWQTDKIGVQASWFLILLNMTV